MDVRACAMTGHRNITHALERGLEKRPSSLPVCGQTNVKGSFALLRWSLSPGADARV